MLVQQRSSDSKNTSVSVPTISVSVSSEASVNSDKASKSLAEISLEVDKLILQVTTTASASTSTSTAGKLTDKDVDNLTEILMTKLIKLDEIVADGDLKLKSKIQVRRVQKHIETLDMLKLQYAMPKNNVANKVTLPHNQKNPNGQIQQQKLKNLGTQIFVHQQQQPVKHSESPVTTTKWETFD